jgi:hypothetical protein
LAKTISTKPEEEFARAYADRLILEKLTEMEAAVRLGELADKLSGAGIGLATVRSLLASNPARFAYHERRWVPAARLESVGRPLNAAVRLLVDRFGAPMPFNLLVTEVQRLRKGDPQTVESAVQRLVDTDPGLILTRKNEVALASWAFLGHDETEERAFQLYKVDAAKVDEAAKKLDGIDWKKDGAIEEALKKAAPIDLKVLAAVAWRQLNPQDPRAVLFYDGREFFSEVVSQDGYLMAADGVIYPEAETKKWISTAVKLADKLAPLVEVEDAAPIDIKPEDVERMIAKIQGSDESVTAIRLLEELYEITPGTKTFPDDLANVMTALKESDKAWWVGGDRFRKPDSAPDFITSVPEPFQFQPSDVRDEEGELVDVELTDEGLSSSLRKLLVHPLAMDVVDEEIMPAPKTMPDTLRLVLKSIHRELGTFPMAQMHTNWLDPEPNVQELIFIDPNGQELQVWANHEARLLYNLIDWWYEQPVESGAVFTLTKTNKPNVFEFLWLDQADPVVYISSQRMEELREIQARSEGMSTLAILMEVMGHWPKGADFLTILAEVNVVRRSPRRLVASLLSSYQSFYQRSGSPVWHFDHKKVEQGFDKTKRKFIKK